jgi:type IV secretory pathway component VirB8
MTKKNTVKKKSVKQSIVKILKWILRVAIIFFVTSVLVVFAMRWINPGAKTNFVIYTW